VKTLTHKFVETMPDTLEEGVLYISISFATAMHKCCCGCGEEVVTPISPMDWKLLFDGDTVSLIPSIGNWAFPCRSHYIIKNNCVHWASSWSTERVEQGRAGDRARKRKFFEERETSLTDQANSNGMGIKDDSRSETKANRHIWEKVWRFWKNL
jgi:hypothetical protein